MAIESTKVRALNEARGLLQTFGFNGFSFQHIADLLGIKKPSLYEHFKSKEDLGRSLIESYQEKFAEWTQTIEVFDPEAKVGALFEVFCKFSTSSGKICPLSAMIADYNSLPKTMKKSLPKLYDFQLSWLQGVIEEGQKKKIFRKDISSSELADLVISLGFGAQLSARVLDEPEKIRSLKKQVLGLLKDK